jgi:peroxiredoxin
MVQESRLALESFSRSGGPMTTRLPLLAFVVLLGSALQGQQPAPRVDVMRLGPQAGQTVPDFRLQDQQGKFWTRDSVMGPNGAMLVFSRSVDWCPYCKTQMIELQSRVAELKAKGLGLAVITYDSPATMADFSRRRGITFPLLSDAGSPTIKAYGILNTTVAPTDARNYGIPFPGTLLIDRSGRVTSRFFEEAYQERNTVSTILLKLGASGTSAAAQRLQTEHLDVTAFLSDEVVAPGSLFSVVFDIKPGPGIHVYAPGARDYRIIGFTPEAQPMVADRGIQYPASEVYEFKPLNERVPVFQKPFRLTQRMTVSAAQQDRAVLAGVEALTIKGTLDYQACDDKVCFNPRSMPVAFTVKLRQLDTERATVAR